MNGNGSKPAPHPLDSALEAFLLELSCDGHRPYTVSEYRKTVQRWLRSGLPPVDYLAAKDVKPSSRTKEGITIRRFLAWAVVHGYEVENPLASVRFKAPPAPLVRPFSEEEIARFLAACRSRRESSIVSLLLETGLRASELANIKPDRDLDQADSTLAIQNGKGGKSRRMGLTRAMVSALDSLGPLNRQKIYKTVRRLGWRAGVENTYPHRFRHTFAHNFLAAGADRGDLRVLLGHTSYVMVDRYCRYWEEERAISAHRRFLAARDASAQAVA